MESAAEVSKQVDALLTAAKPTTASDVAARQSALEQMRQQQQELLDKTIASSGRILALFPLTLTRVT